MEGSARFQGMVLEPDEPPSSPVGAAEPLGPCGLNPSLRFKYKYEEIGLGFRVYVKIPNRNLSLRTRSLQPVLPPRAHNKLSCRLCCCCYSTVVACALFVSAPLAKTAADTANSAPTPTEKGVNRFRWFSIFSNWFLPSSNGSYQVEKLVPTKRPKSLESMTL